MRTGCLSCRQSACAVDCHVLLGDVAAVLGPLPLGFLFDVTDSYNRAVLIFLALPRKPGRSGPA